ncbi:hypothetical protein [Azospirillum argentinense]
MSTPMPKSDYAAIRAPQRWDDSSCGWSRGSEWLFSGVAYKCLDASDGNAVWITDADGISPALSANGDGSSVTVLSPASITPRTLAQRASDIAFVKDFGARCDGASDDTAALAVAVAASPGRTLVINGPMYLASPQSITVPSTVTLRFDGNGTLKWDFGVLQGVIVASAGGDFTTMPGVSIAGSTLATTAKLTRVEVVAGGVGYAQGDILTVPGVTGTAPPVIVVETVDGAGAILQARPDWNALGSVSSIPTNPVSITGGAGSGASLNLFWNINTVSVTAGGAYITPPPVTISGVYTHKPVVIPLGRYPTIFGAVEAPTLKPIFSGNYRYVHGAIRSPTAPVTWWGAAGGIDSTHAFQCGAFQALAVDGVLEVPPQSTPYRVGSVALGIQYSLRSCAVVGPSRRDVPYTGTGALIKLLDGHDGHMFVKPMRTGAVQLRNLRLDGNQPMQTPGAKSSAIFFEDDWTRSYYWGGAIEACWITDTAWHGIYIGWHQDAGHMRDVWVQYAGGGTWAPTGTVTDNGVHGILNRAYDWKYSNVDVGRCYGDGLHIERGSQIQITSLASYGNGGCGLSLDTTSTDLMIATSAFDHNKKHGIRLDGVGVGSLRAGRAVTGCVFRGNSRSAHNTYSDIYVAGDRDLSVTGCAFDGSPDSTRPKYCIEFDAVLSPDTVAWTGNTYGTSGRLSYETALTNSPGKLVLAGHATAGLRTPLTDTLALTTGGVERVRVDASGNLVVGGLSSIQPGTAPTYRAGAFQVRSTGAGMNVERYATAGSSPPALYLAKSNSATLGAHGAVSDGTITGEIQFHGSDGTKFIASAAIRSAVDGAPGTDDMPGRLLFLTTADGGTIPAERFRIDNTGALTHRGGATVIVDANSHLGLRPYTVATLPSAAAADRLISVSNGSSNRRLAISDGTNWRWPDGAVVS